MSYHIGYVGLGNMGTQICNNLCKYAADNDLETVMVWNRSPEKAKAISGAKMANDLEDLVDRCNVVFTCLLNDAVAEETYSKMFKAASTKQGKADKVIFIDQSSLNPKTASKLEADAREGGSVYLSSPVFGPPPVAKTAQLLLVLAGDEEAKAFVKPLLVPTVGKGIIDVGAAAAKGATLKLLGNTCILGTIELLGEAYALADSIDFEPAVFQDFVRQWFPAAAWVNYGTKISKGSFAGGQGFRVDGGLKDARNILTLGQDLGHPCPVPTIETAAKNLIRAKEIGGDDMDWSSLAIVLREQAGLPPFRSGSDKGKTMSNGK